eukprot:jgi/Bigna1/131720/aug1.15_g6428
MATPTTPPPIIPSLTSLTKMTSSHGGNDSYLMPVAIMGCAALLLLLIRQIVNHFFFNGIFKNPVDEEIGNKVESVRRVRFRSKASQMRYSTDGNPRKETLINVRWTNSKKRTNSFWSRRNRFVDARSKQIQKSKVGRRRQRLNSFTPSSNDKKPRRQRKATL